MPSWSATASSQPARSKQRGGVDADAGRAVQVEPLRRVEGLGFGQAPCCSADSGACVADAKWAAAHSCGSRTSSRSASPPRRRP